MKNFINNIKISNRELKNVKSLVGASLFLALDIVLSFFRLDLTPSLRITFSFIPVFLTALMYGPVVAGLSAGLGDILKFMLKPTGPYFFGFTFNAILGGIIMGIFVYRTKVTAWKVAAARFSVIVVCNVVLNTLWLDILYGKGFIALLMPRVIKNIILLPIECVILMAVIKVMDKKFRFQN